MQPSCGNTDRTGMSEHDTHWSAKASWMRRVGAADAAWSTEGDLVHLALRPEVPEPETNRDPNPAKQLSPQEQEQRARQERRRVALLASGGPVKRLDADAD